MSRDKYILKVDNPCNEDWSSMTENEAGKFCSSCSKSVVDFASLTDSEIVSLLERNTEKICGRLNAHQIDRLLKNDNVSRGSNVYRYLAGLLLLGSTQASVAETVSLVPDTEIRSTIQEETNFQVAKPDEQFDKDTAQNIIRGVLIDQSTGETIPFGSILLKDTKIGTTSDFDGNFELTLTDELETDKVVVKATVIGYVSTEIIIKKSELPVLKLKISMSPANVMMGEVIIIKHRKWWQRKKKN